MCSPISRLNLGSGGAPAGQGGPSGGPEGAVLPAIQAALLKAMRRLMRETEDVGARFAEEARRIHYGEIRERPIRGRASPEETRDLLEEGVPVMPLPLPPGWDGELQ